MWRLQGVDCGAIGIATIAWLVLFLAKDELTKLIMKQVYRQKVPLFNLHLTETGCFELGLDAWFVSNKCLVCSRNRIDVPVCKS